MMRLMQHGGVTLVMRPWLLHVFLPSTEFQHIGMCMLATGIQYKSVDDMAAPLGQGG